MCSPRLAYLLYKGTSVSFLSGHTVTHLPLQPYLCTFKKKKDNNATFSAFPFFVMGEFHSSLCCVLFAVTQSGIWAKLTFSCTRQETCHGHYYSGEKEVNKHTQTG